MSAVVQSCGHAPLARHGCGLPAGEVPVDDGDTSPTSRSGSPAVWDITGGSQRQLPGVPTADRADEARRGLIAGAAPTRHAAHGTTSAGTRRAGWWERVRWLAGQWGHDRWRGGQRGRDRWRGGQWGRDRWRAGQWGHDRWRGGQWGHDRWRGGQRGRDRWRGGQWGRDR